MLRCYRGLHMILGMGYKCCDMIILEQKVQTKKIHRNAKCKPKRNLCCSSNINIDTYLY